MRMTMNIIEVQGRKQMNQLRWNHLWSPPVGPVLYVSVKVELRQESKTRNTKLKRPKDFGHKCLTGGYGLYSPESIHMLFSTRMCAPFVHGQEEAGMHTNGLSEV